MPGTHSWEIWVMVFTASPRTKATPISASNYYSPTPSAFFPLHGMEKRGGGGRAGEEEGEGESAGVCNSIFLLHRLSPQLLSAGVVPPLWYELSCAFSVTSKYAWLLVCATVDAFCHKVWSLLGLSVRVHDRQAKIWIQIPNVHVPWLLWFPVL